MDELQESLSRLLEDPEELKRMTDMASQLLGGGEAPEPESPKLPDLSALMGKLRGGNSDTQKLLQQTPTSQMTDAWRPAVTARGAEAVFGCSRSTSWCIN